MFLIVDMVVVIRLLGAAGLRHDPELTDQGKKGRTRLLLHSANVLEYTCLELIIQCN